MKKSILGNQISRSPLVQQSALKRGATSNRKSILVASLNLTTLIDAFCILVIFLLSNMNSQTQSFEVSKNIILPSVKVSDLMTVGTVVKVENQNVFVDDVKISMSQIVAVLIGIKDKKAIVIQADKLADFSLISEVIRAGGQAGFSNYLFAVWPGK